MADDTLPPVGATVVDADGQTYTVGVNALGGRRWTERWRGCDVGVGSRMNATLTRIWQLEQELAALRALAREARSEGVWDPYVPTRAAVEYVERLIALAKETTT